MRIAQATDDRLVITHGSAILLAMWVVLSAALAWGLAFLAAHLGFANEPVAYTGLALAVCVYGALTTRLTTFTFDRGRGELHWRRRGLIPVSGTVAFARIEKATLDQRADRRGTAFYRVVLVLGDGQAISLTPGRTRDVYQCLELVEAIAGVLGHPRMADLLADGRTDEAARLAEVRHGVPRDRAEAYFSWRDRRAARGATAAGGAP